MNKGILGRKLGMTQIFDEDGRAVPVTVIEAGPCVVIRKKTVETDGYNAVQIGFLDIKDKHVTKPLKGHFARHGVKPHRIVRELRLNNLDNIEPGQELKADLFEAGELVDVTGTSKGKGTAGPIKRHNFSRGPMAHGSKYHRGTGSLSARMSGGGGRVFKGRKMAGRMGGNRVTVQGLKVVRVDSDRNLLLIRGAVPGAQGATVIIRDSVKAPGARAQRS